MIALRGKLFRAKKSGEQDKPAAPAPAENATETTATPPENDNVKDEDLVWTWKGHWAFENKLATDDKAWQPFLYTFEKAVLPGDVLIPSLNEEEAEADNDDGNDQDNNSNNNNGQSSTVDPGVKQESIPESEKKAEATPAATAPAAATDTTKASATGTTQNSTQAEKPTETDKKDSTSDPNQNKDTRKVEDSPAATPMEVDDLKQSASMESVVTTTSTSVAEPMKLPTTTTKTSEETTVKQTAAPTGSKTDAVANESATAITSEAKAAAANSAADTKPKAMDVDAKPKAAAEEKSKAAAAADTTTPKESDVDSNKPSKVTFATPMDPDDPPYTDAGDKYPDKCPKGGKWKGYFENVTKTINRRRQNTVISTVQQIPETFHLYLNATPPKAALTNFLIEPEPQQETADKATKNDTDEKLNDNDKGRLPPGKLHVRGTGENQFGTFEIIGSFDLDTQILEIVRMYVNLEPAPRSRAPSRSRARSNSVRNNNTATTDDGRPYFTRKRPMSWKRRSSFGSTGSDSDEEGTPTSSGQRRKSTGPGGGGKRVRLSDPKGGSVGTSDVGSVGSTPTPATGKKTLSITIPTGGKRPGPGSGTPRSKKSGGSTPTSTLSKQQLTALGLSPSSPKSNYMRLPTVEDPKMAVWRAAHFLYYQKTDPALEESANLNFGGHSAAAGAYKYVVYEGDLFKSQREGRGVCVYSNQMMYEGEWKRNKEHGRGTLMSSDRKRIIYEGEWERGRMHGRGTYYYSAGVTLNAKDQVVVLSTSKKKGSGDTKGFVGGNSRYEGDFKENLRHGYGKYVLPDGSVYEGTWREGLMNGRGVFTWKDGSVYDGEWKDGKRHGSGILRASDGFLYDGMWVQNAMEGRGTAVYPNGQQYNGLFSNGRREGRGTLLFTNGAVYEGRFRDDKVDGQGTMKMPTVMTVPRQKKMKTKGAKDEGNEGEGAAVDQEEKGQESEGEDKNLKPDFMIPLSFQSDMSHIHQKAGFTHVGE